MIDEFFFKKYNRNTYNCAHLVSDVWLKLTGQDISERLRGFLKPVRLRSVGMDLRHEFVRLKCPQSPCIVLMNRPGAVAHVGVYYRGKVLHIHASGTEYVPLDVASRGFTTVRFYSC